MNSIHRADAVAGPGRSEPRNVDILPPLARQRESPTGPNVPCERRTDPAEPPSRHGSPAPAPLLRHRKTGESTPRACGVPSERSGCAPYLGFHPGLECGAPLGHSERLTSPEPPRPRRQHHNIPVQRQLFSSWATIKPSPYRDRPSSNPAAAGPGRSEHRNVDILTPLARQRESPAGPNVPCERGTDPAEPLSRHGSPAPAPLLRHRKTGESTPRACGVPSERSGCAPYLGFHPGLECGAPLGHSERITSPEPPRPQRQHHNTPVQRQLFSSWATIKPSPYRDRPSSNPAAAGPGRSEHRNVDILIPPRAPARKPNWPQRSLRAQDRSRGAPVEARIPSASPGTPPPQNR